MPFVERHDLSRFMSVMPERIARLPVDHRGFPVPWFVSWIDGKPDHRVVDTAKLRPAVEQGRCWICGEPLGRHKAFITGPMCAVTRTNAEPPSHRGCAEFAAQACPFLSIPAKRRRENNLPDEASFSENGLKRNPGVVLVWVTNGFSPMRDPGGPGYLFRMDDPSAIVAYCEGRPARWDEVMASIDSGLPALQKMADAEGPAASLYLVRLRREAIDLLATMIPGVPLPQEKES